jgi:MFS family permease
VSSVPAAAPATHTPPSGLPTFRALLARNRNVRLLWLGQIVSQLGDWFNVVAVYALMLDLTRSATAVAVMMVLQTLPIAAFGPMAGVIVDRVDRRRLMVWTDVVRGVLMFGLLLVRDAGDIWIAYVVITLAVVATAFFEPARSAILPSITSRDELLPANALSAATWATMLAAGAAIGGLIMTLLGRDVAFVLNAMSFFASALFIARIRVPGRPDRAAASGVRAPQAGFAAGLRYIRGHARVAALLSVKGAWAIAGGVMLLLTVFGERVLPIAGSTAAGIGVLYAARGVGSGLGAVGTRWLLGSDHDKLRASIGPAYLAIGTWYIAFAVSPTLWMAALAVAAAHVGGSVLWVASAVLLQSVVPDEFRGRVFAIEFALLTLVSGTMSYATAFGLDHLHVPPRTLGGVLGSAFFVPGLVWLASGRSRPAIASGGSST